MTDWHEHELEDLTVLLECEQKLEQLTKFWPRRRYQLDFPDMTIGDMCKTGRLLGYDSPFRLRQRSEAIIWFEGVLRLRRYKSVIGGFEYAGRRQHHVHDANLKIVPFSFYSETVKKHYLGLATNITADGGDVSDSDDADAGDVDIVDNENTTTDNNTKDGASDSDRKPQQVVTIEDSDDEDDESSDKYRFQQRNFIAAVCRAGLIASKGQRLYHPDSVPEDDGE